MANQNWIGNVIKGLQKEPAYLLIFALSAIFFLGGIGTAVAGVIQKGNLGYLLISAVLWIAALVCAVLVIFRVTGRKSTWRPQPGKTVIDEDLLVNSGIDAPKDADLKIRKTKAFGSPITIHDPDEKDQKDHARDGS